MIELVESDPTWPETFDELRRRYAAALADVPVISIEHVGSTSVPGMAAKPIIDVDIVVERDQVAAAIAAMERVGFRPVGDLGITDRWAFDAPPHLPRTNTYVVVDGSLALRNHLAVRDTLRADPQLRDRYAAVKRRLADTVDDIDAYVEGKSAVLTEILDRAGLSSTERAEIREANRAT